MPKENYKAGNNKTEKEKRIEMYDRLYDSNNPDFVAPNIETTPEDKKGQEKKIETTNRKAGASVNYLEKKWIIVEAIKPTKTKTGAYKLKDDKGFIMKVTDQDLDMNASPKIEIPAEVLKIKTKFENKKFCPSCGQQVGNEQFCGNCGYELVDEKEIEKQKEIDRKISKLKKRDGIYIKDKEGKWDLYIIDSKNIEKGKGATFIVVSKEKGDFKPLSSENLIKEIIKGQISLDKPKLSPEELSANLKSLEHDSEKWHDKEKSKLEQKVFNANTFEELYKVLDEIKTVKGSRKEYNAEELKEDINIARGKVLNSDTMIKMPAVDLSGVNLAKAFPDYVGAITKKLGLRSKVEELLKSELLEKRMSNLETDEDNPANPKIDLGDVKQYVENHSSKSASFSELFTKLPEGEDNKLNIYGYSKLVFEFATSGLLKDIDTKDYQSQMDVLGVGEKREKAIKAFEEFNPSEIPVYNLEPAKKILENYKNDNPGVQEIQIYLDAINKAMQEKGVLPESEEIEEGENNPPEVGEKIRFDSIIWEVRAIEESNSEKKYFLKGYVQAAGSKMPTIRIVKENDLLGNYEKLMSCAACGEMNTKGTAYCQYCGADLTAVVQPKASSVEVENSFYISPISEKTAPNLEENKENAINNLRKIIENAQEKLKRNAELRKKLLEELAEIEGVDTSKAEEEIENVAAAEEGTLREDLETLDGYSPLYTPEIYRMKIDKENTEEELKELDRKLEKAEAEIKNQKITTPLIESSNSAIKFLGLTLRAMSDTLKLFLSEPTSSDLNKKREDLKHEKEAREGELFQLKKNLMETIAQKKKEIEEENQRIEAEEKKKQEEKKLAREALGKDREENPVKYFLIEQMAPVVRGIIYGQRNIDELTMEEVNEIHTLNNVTDETGKNLIYWNWDTILPRRWDTLSFSSNGFTIQLANREELDLDVQVKREDIIENKKAKYRIVTPDWKTDGEIYDNFEQANSVMTEKAESYQEEQLKKFEKENTKNK